MTTQLTDLYTALFDALEVLDQQLDGYGLKFVEFKKNRLHWRKRTIKLTHRLTTNLDQFT